MSSRFLTVAEAARYLRLNPRSVYLLAQRGAIPASRVTGKWLFPVHLLDEWIETSARGAGAARRERPGAGVTLPAGGLFLAGSDDPALEILPDALRGQAGHPLLFMATVGRVGGLGRWARVAPTWPPAPRSSPRPGSPTSRTSPAFCRAVRRWWSTPSSGSSGSWSGRATRAKLDGVGDLGRRGLRFVNRQPGSATRAFTDEALAAAGVEQGAWWATGRRCRPTGRWRSGSSAARPTPGSRRARWPRR